MCLVLESEVILANVLSRSVDYGIDRNGLAEYCDKIKEELTKITEMSSKYVYFDITQDSVNNAVKLYHDFFIEIGDKIFPYRKINVEYFNSRFPVNITNSLKVAADNYMQLQKN
jgi:hypothetical protein